MDQNSSTMHSTTQFTRFFHFYMLILKQFALVSLHFQVFNQYRIGITNRILNEREYDYTLPMNTLQPLHIGPFVTGSGTPGSSTVNLTTEPSSNVTPFGDYGEYMNRRLLLIWVCYFEELVVHCPEFIY